jgi:hypothetical protein
LPAFLFRGKNKDVGYIGVLAIMFHDKGLTAEGKPRKRRPGGGRPPKHGETTKSVRVPVSVSTQLISSIPELQRILDHWEEQCIAAGDNSARHHFLRQAIDEIRALGF